MTANSEVTAKVFFAQQMARPKRCVAEYRHAATTAYNNLEQSPRGGRMAGVRVVGKSVITRMSERREPL